MFKEIEIKGLVTRMTLVEIDEDIVPVNGNSFVGSAVVNGSQRRESLLEGGVNRVVLACVFD